ncbi:hypothetical protein RAK27_18460 [Carnobacterium maltaromaticum]|uniref:DUF3800 domain-containing protein n=1 Tax=Carnobacterium maltaromaticum TaxID=2751 RepID=A0AAW9JVT2_CARML|nr:hypothetical protein [Carnobacterium maltaromaticum]MDZ5760627.1 hypothetical protein [Carnobacterium maltaromaticum]
MRAYNFYFDESSHDFRISNKTILDSEDYSDSYVGMFIGIPKTNISVISQYSVIEKYYKSMFVKSGELKGTKIKNIKSTTPKEYFSGKETFIDGVASFDNHVTKFYSDFFSIFTNDLVMQLCIVSKFEQNLMSCLDISKIETQISMDLKLSMSRVDSTLMTEVFLYSLVKFFYTYRNSETFEKLYDSKIPKSSKVNALHSLLNSVLSNSYDVERKNVEVEVIPRIKQILTKDNLRVKLDNRFNHDMVIDGFRELLKENRINPKNIDMFPDKSSGIDFTIEKYNYFQECDSKNSLEVRIADVFSSFVSRIIFAIRNTTEENWGTQESLENFADLKNLPESWFHLNKNQFLLYLKISNIFQDRENISWFTHTGLYFDDGVWFISIIKYFSQYSTFDEYSRLTPKEHERKAAQYTVSYLQKSYNQRGWQV